MAFGSEFTLDWSILKYPSEFFMYKILACNLIESVTTDLSIFIYAGSGISGLTRFPMFCFFFLPPCDFFFWKTFLLGPDYFTGILFFFVYLLLCSHPHSFIHSLSYSFIHKLIDSCLLTHIFFSSFSPRLIHSLNLYKQNMKRHL